MRLTLCVLLWAWPGAEDGLIAYEDRVLRLMDGALVEEQVTVVRVSQA